MFDVFFAAIEVGRGCESIFEYIEKTQQNQNCTKLLLKKFVEYANGEFFFWKREFY